jgi:hypothetical protein
MAFWVLHELYQVKQVLRAGAGRVGELALFLPSSISIEETSLAVNSPSQNRLADH